MIFPFFENPLVSHVQRRICIRDERLNRSAYDVLILSGFERPLITVRSTPAT
jgi:hypothetical protein